MFSAHKFRLNRFLAADGRCLDVAIDHGVFNEHAFLDGLDDMPAVVAALVAAGPDAIQMNVGQADLLQSIRGPRKPALVRQARELGADVIKADATEHAEDYHEVVQAARCPILVRGGGKKPIEFVFAEAAAVLAQGAHGLVYGRNIYQHPNPSRIMAARMAIIHDGADAARAMAIYGADH